MTIGVSSLFLELGIILIITAFATYILKIFKQPQILAYVLVGVLIGPVFNFFSNSSIVSPETIESTSLIGIAFLLFIVGLEMDIKSLKNVTLVSSLGGIIQIISVALLGYLISIMLGFINIEAIYMGLIITFSSTMVVLKLLSDKRELQTLHGRISIGILLTQDVVAILALSILTSVDGFNIMILGISLLKFLAMFSIAYLASKYIFPYIFNFAARYQELLLITSLAVCFIFSLAFHFLGFSIAIGAFVAGITLGNLTYNYQIIGKVKSLKDFFSLIFFVSLGMGLSIAAIKKMWLPLIFILITVMILKPFIIMTICSLFKYTKKPSFLTANSLAQVGEFSLILAAQGFALKHISQEFFSLTVVITLISITLTSYYIEYNNWFYKLLEKPLKMFDLFTTQGLEFLPTTKKPKIILCGHNRVGYSILRNLRKEKDNVLVVDYNPEIIQKMVSGGHHCIYGEVSDEEIIEKMNLKHIELLVSTVPNVNDNLLIIRKTREVNKRARLIITANDVDEAMRLYNHGADYVILPHFLGGEHASLMIKKIRKNKTNLKEERKDHIKHLKERKYLGHEHPKHE